MNDLSKSILSPFVRDVIAQEHKNIRAEIRERGPFFDYASLNDRLKRAKERAEAEEKASATQQKQQG